EEPPHDIELVVPGEDLDPLLAAGLLVARLDDLGVVLDDVGETGFGENLLPEVVGLESVGIGRVARAIPVALVEGEEPGVLPLERGAEPHLLVIYGEVDQAAAELEEPLAWVAVVLVLLD